MRERVVDEIWESGRPVARVARALLAPLGWTFGVVVRCRNAAYDHEWLPQHSVALPTVSVGNLTVGGTGKTPVSAWLAARLRERGAAPGIVLRGYGGDETLVHRLLNPGIPVIEDPNRVEGIARARDEGATVALLDDAFQHRRARRTADVVLLSADRYGPVRLLPAGPWREPLSSLDRATVVVVTRKAASRIRALELLSHARRYAPHAEGAIIHLSSDRLVACSTGEARPADGVSRSDVLAISAIAAPRAFESELRRLGARVTGAAYRDHHDFTEAEAAWLAVRATSATWAVCTLKDAVKLTPLWPREAPPLWYLSQRVIVEEGGASLDALIERLAPQVTS